MTASYRTGIIICFLCISLPHKGYSQLSMASKEAEFVRLYAALQNSYGSGADSTETYSEKFSSSFTGFIKANPATLNYPFQRLIDSNFCFIKTSADGNFRIYSWDNLTGGTMHWFNQVYQWRDKGKIFTKIPKADDQDPGGFCSEIYTVTIQNKAYYLVISNRIFSTRDASQSITVITINGNRLTDTAKLFHTKTKQYNRVDVDFDFFSVVDHPERPLQLITYDDKLQVVYIPVVDNKQQVTERNILYQLKGDHFEFIGIEKGKRK